MPCPRFGSNGPRPLTVRPRRPRARRPLVEPLEGRILQSRDPGAAAVVAARASRPLAVNNVTVLTTPSGRRLADVTVTRTGPLAGPLAVRFRTLDGTARAGRDYRAGAGVLRLAAGQSTAVIAVPIAATVPSSAHRRFAVRVAGRLGGHPVRARGTVTIDNNAGLEDRPTISPIDTEKRLYDWRWFEHAEDDPASDPNVAAVPLQGRIQPSGPPSLAGFDLQMDAKGGPLGWQYDPFSTRWSQGGTGSSPDGIRSAANIYNFAFWQYLDISYYFGHQLLTLPPTMWTDAAHANGVVSLGTLDLNRPEAAAILNRKTSARLAGTLTEIARYYGFDGFLVNYEPGGDEHASGEEIDADAMLDLLGRLKASNLTVVWYDSKLSAGGDASYANYLNPAAVRYLKTAGDFQTNYSWGAYSDDPDNPITPEDSYETLLDADCDEAETLADCDEAETLKDHVFSALDPYRQHPWGKDSKFFSTLNSVFASEDPGRYYTGVGLFAPNWTYYDGLNPAVRPRSALEAQARDQAFWTGTGPYMSRLPGFGPAESVSATVSPRSVIRSAPFSTDFNTGEGSFYNVQGARASTGPWSDLAVQSILPTYRFTETSSSTASATAELQYIDAYNGGSSLVIAAPGLSRGASAGFNLFETSIAASTVGRITYTVKPEGGTALPEILSTVNPSTGGTVSIASTATAGQDGWVTLSFPIPSSLNDATIQGIGLTVIGTAPGAAPVELAVGQMQVLGTGSAPAPALIPEPAALRLDWSSEYNPASSYRIYGKIGGQYDLLGVTRGSTYATQGIILNRTVSGYTSYLVQEVNAAGQSSPLPGPMAVGIPADSDPSATRTAARTTPALVTGSTSHRRS